jgi:hypothetical protein
MLGNGSGVAVDTLDGLGILKSDFAPWSDTQSPKEDETRRPGHHAEADDEVSGGGINCSRFSILNCRQLSKAMLENPPRTGIH